jgi:hypothetical protein
MATINFDATTVDPGNGFEPIPAGKYLAVISEDEMKPTRNNNGQYLQLTIEIIEGDYQGRKIWARLNLENPNMQAVEIARKELSAICRAVNVLQLTDTTQLLNIPFVLKVGLKKNKETDEMENVIKGYEAKTNYAPASAPAAAAPQSATPPWAKR